MMGTKRLTSFAIKFEDQNIRSSILEELREYDNHTENREGVDQHKYAEETLFKTCFIKKW